MSGTGGYAPSWYPDPSGQHQLRYFDGHQWTERVSCDDKVPVSLPGKTPSLGPNEKFKIEYNTVNNYILHYSNVRSALASFLITVALGSFGGYYSTRGAAGMDERSFLGVPRGPHILWVAGYLFLLAAVMASLYFSYWTERTTNYSTQLWKWAIEGTRPYPGGFRGSSTSHEGVWGRVAKDPMNGLLVGGAVVLGIAFYLFEVAL